MNESAKSPLAAAAAVRDRVEFQVANILGIPVLTWPGSCCGAAFPAWSGPKGGDAAPAQIVAERFLIAGSDKRRMAFNPNGQG